jgi:D-serine deaminase-like pyridoxal phosphate-dependent protein
VLLRVEVTQPHYDSIRAALAGERLPAAFVDLDALDRNLERHLAIARAHGKNLRVASKSVRVPAILERLLEGGGSGLMCFSAREARFLADRGFDDLLLAYPPWQEADLDALLDVAGRGSRLCTVVDCREAADRIAERAARRGIWLDLLLCADMSLRAAGGRVHVGVRRSPLHSPADVLTLARHVRELAGVRLAGIMAYEAQVAGLGDDSPFAPLGNPLKSAVRRISIAEVRARRAAILEALARDGFSLAIVNAGGTGSLESSSVEPVVTEVTAGSGFFKPHLFDYYRSAHVRALEPACFFALEITRRPAPDLVTCLGGGYVASGPPGPDKVPLPYLPAGLELLRHEMCGEVQTPLRLPRDGTPALRLGDPVIFRHAKAGELCERFREVLLLSGDRIVDRAPTYRGEGECFF